MKFDVFVLALCGILISVIAVAGELLPVRAWPRVLNLDGKQIVNPDVGMCVSAGYRLIPAERPATPKGKQIASERFEQDPERKENVRWVIEYEDIPPAPAPEVLTNVPAAKVTFQFTTNGEYRGVVWQDGPGRGRTNGVER